MRRLIRFISAAVAALALSVPVFAQSENTGIDIPEFFSLPETVTDEYLDSLDIPVNIAPNDYWIVGAHYGVTGLLGYFNPPRSTAFTPVRNAFGVSVTKYGTFLNTMHMVGLEFGLQKTYEGYTFKMNKETGYTQHIFYATSAVYDVYEANFLAHLHFDTGAHSKILAKLGVFGGYRDKVHREGYEGYLLDEMKDGFVEDYPTNGDQLYSDFRYTYGVEGGVGFGLMFDPLEIHLGAQLKWGWREFHNPDYLSPYYYRFSYPLDVMLQVGVYYQLTPRHGYTRYQLRKMARNIARNNVQYDNSGNGR